MIFKIINNFPYPQRQDITFDYSNTLGERNWNGEL